MNEGLWTPVQVSEFFHGSPTVNTLAIWRSRGGGPRFVKLGRKKPGCKLDRRKVAYPISEVKAWAVKNGLQEYTIAAAAPEGDRP